MQLCSWDADITSTELPRCARCSSPAINTRAGRHERPLILCMTVCCQLATRNKPCAARMRASFAATAAAGRWCCSADPVSIIAVCWHQFSSDVCDCYHLGCVQRVHCLPGGTALVGRPAATWRASKQEYSRVEMPLYVPKKFLRARTPQRWLA